MFNIHFDFHNAPNIDAILPNFDYNKFAENIKHTTSANRVNWFLQDNMGFCYYPSKIGITNPGLDHDMFKEGLDAFHKNNINVYGYINVALNHRLANEKPNWLRADITGRTMCGHPLDPFCRTMCLNTGYADFVLDIVKESIELYPNMDGLFVDNVLVKPCWCSKCIGEMKNNGVDVTSKVAVTDFARSNALKLVKKIKDICGDMPVDIKGLDRVSDTAKYSDTIYYALASEEDYGIGCIANAKYLSNFGKVQILDGRFIKSWEDFGGYRPPDSIAANYQLCKHYGFDYCLGDHLHPNYSADFYDGFYDDRLKQSLEASECKKLQISNIAVVCSTDGPSSETISACAILDKLNLDFSVIDISMDASSFETIIVPDGLSPTSKIKNMINSFNGKVISAGSSVIFANSFIDPRYNAIPYCDQTVSYYKIGGEVISAYNAAYTLKSEFGLIEHIKPYNQVTTLEKIPYYLCPPDSFDGQYLVSYSSGFCHIGFNIFKAYNETNYYKYEELIKYILEKGLN